MTSTFSETSVVVDGTAISDIESRRDIDVADEKGRGLNATNGRPRKWDVESNHRRSGSMRERHGVVRRLLLRPFQGRGSCLLATGALQPRPFSSRPVRGYGIWRFATVGDAHGHGSMLFSSMRGCFESVAEPGISTGSIYKILLIGEVFAADASSY